MINKLCVKENVGIFLLYFVEVYVVKQLNISLIVQIKKGKYFEIGMVNDFFLKVKFNYRYIYIEIQCIY